MQNKEKKILEEALEIFEKTTGLKAHLKTEHPNNENYTDALVQIAHQKMQRDFAVDVKTKVTRATVILKKLDQFNREENALLITEYVTPPIADQLKELNIFFIDTAGNAFINELPLYVFVKGNKPRLTLREEPQKRLFKPSGLKTIFALLSNPGLVNKPYRDIAEAADVALGTIGWLIKDLKEMGFCTEFNKNNRKLWNLEKLIKRWVEAYPEQLRPKVIRGRFETTNHNWWEEIDIKMYKAFWGGEVAAANLTNYLKPTQVTIYTNEPLGKLVLKNKLRKATKGSVEILTRFWNFKYELEDQNVVPPILIYADLVATADPRNIEAAGIIYEKYLDRLIREN